MTVWAREIREDELVPVANKSLARRLMRQGYDTVAFSTFADRHSQPWFMPSRTEYHTPNLKTGNDPNEEVNARALPWLKQNAHDDPHLRKLWLK